MLTHIPETTPIDITSWATATYDKREAFVDLGTNLAIAYATHFSNPITEAVNMAKINIRPLSDRVLVKRLDEAEEQSVGGIIIPDTAKEKPQEAEVVAIGPGRLEDGNRVAPEVNKGDKVLIGKYSGTEVKVDGEDYLIMREDDILAIVG